MNRSVLAAEKVRAAWSLGLDPLPNVIETLETNGVKVFEVEAPEHFDGFSGWAGGHPVVVLSKWLNKDMPRKRFTALHEIAHLLIHAHIDSRGKETEPYCNRFASAILIPQKVFKTDWGGYRTRVSLAELIDLKRAATGCLLPLSCIAQLTLSCWMHPHIEDFALCEERKSGMKRNLETIQALKNLPALTNWCFARLLKK